MSEDIDIQAEKQKYLKFRKKKLSRLGIIFVLLGVWFSLLLPVIPDKTYSHPVDFYEAVVAIFSYFLTSQGFFVLFFGACLFGWLYRIGSSWKKYHFRCPSENCDEAIFLRDSWVCPIDRSVTDPPWTFWYTIFTRCKAHGHPSPAHRCPSCGHVFKLLENPRTGVNKFSYRPGSLPNQAQNQVRAGEVVSRNNPF